MGLRFGLPVRWTAKVLILCTLFWKVSGMLELLRCSPRNLVFVSEDFSSPMGGGGGAKCFCCNEMRNLPPVTIRFQGS